MAKRVQKDNRKRPQAHSIFRYTFDEGKHIPPAVKHFQPKNQDGEETIARINLGYACLRENKIVEATENFAKASKLARKQKNELNETIAYIALGRVHIQNNQTEMAIIYYEKALAIAIKREDKENEICAYIGLGNAFEKDDEIDQAIDNYKKTLRIAKELQDKQNEKIALNGLRRVYEKKEQTQTVITNNCHEKALETARKHKLRENETTKYIMLGEAFAKKNPITLKITKKWGDRENQIIPKAIEHYEKTSEIARERRDKKEEKRTQNAIETLSTHKGKL